MIASIPNVAHGSVRLALMQGRFEYLPFGLVDETHLRFFTRESVEQLFDAAGFSITGLERTTRDILDTEIEVNTEAIEDEILELVREAQGYNLPICCEAPSLRRRGTGNGPTAASRRCWSK